jgi:hypothetical protein
VKRQLCPALFAVALLCGCFPFGVSERHVVGPYQLEQWEEGETYRLHDRHYDDSKIGGSIIEGTVTRIGWNDDYIVAERKPTWSGDGSGWMIIDVNRDRIAGPFTDEQMASRAEVRHIVTHSAAEAWKLL